MASWGDVTTYNNMIKDLDDFSRSLGSAHAAMTTAAHVCTQVMENDAASAKAAQNVQKCCEKYKEASDLAQKLKRSLEQERDDMIEYLRSLEELEDN